MANILYRGSGVPSAYATSIAGGAGANRALTNLEIDQNFFALDNLKFDKSSSTSSLSEGTNLYFTDARARSSISVSGSLGYNSSTGVISYSTPSSLPASDVSTWAKAATKPSYSSNEITENTNLYFTTARARASISASGSLAYDSSTGVISYTYTAPTIPTTLPASDVSTWAKAATKPSYSSNEITENTNLYFTNARARSAISVSGSLGYDSSTGVISYTYTAPTTSSVSEGTNLYFTNARARSAISVSGSLGYDSSTGVISYSTPATPTTSSVSEGTNLYFTNARARSAISVSGSLGYDSSTGVISYTTPTIPTTLPHNGTALNATTGSFSSSITCSGNLTVGQSANASYIYMVDVDEGVRVIHCNSNRIGFLAQENGWGSWCEDDGSWVSSQNITAYSDIKLKTNIQKIDNALNKVCQLNGYTFDRIDVEVPRQTGVIAQEVQKVLPEAVSMTGDTMTVAYGNMVGILIEAIKELNAKVEDLQNQLVNK